MLSSPEYLRDQKPDKGRTRGTPKPREDFLHNKPCGKTAPDSGFIYYLLPPSPQGRRQCLYRSLRAISTARLNVSPRLHLRPIDVVVSDGPHFEILSWRRLRA